MRGLARQAAPQTSNADDPSRSKRPGDRGQCRGPTTEHRSSPWAPHQPKLARNSGTRTLCSAPKRCNSNDVISMFEIHVGELRATFLRNHNMRRYKGTTKCPKQKTTQAQKTPTSPATTTARSTGAVHPIWGTAPDMGRCTRTEEVHCLRIGCSAPTYKNKRGTGTPNHSPPHPSMRSWALLVAGRARRPRHHLHPGPLRHLPHPYMRRADLGERGGGARGRESPQPLRPHSPRAPQRTQKRPGPRPRALSATIELR